MRKKSVISVIIFSLFLIPLCSASFILSNQTVQKNYNSGDVIQGSMRISFQNEPAHSAFTSNLGGNLTLYDILTANGFVEGQDYSCNPIGCGQTYSPVNTITTLSLSKKETLGLVIKDSDVNDIQDATFTIESDASPSCSSQLSVNILDSLFTSNEYTNKTCFNKGYGCFNSSAQVEEVKIGTNPYCEKITLPQGPAYRVGARVNALRGNKSDLIMDIRDTEDPLTVLGQCTLPRPGMNIQELECDIPYSLSEQKEKYVCIYSEDEYNYTINFEKQSPSCGTANLGASESIRDFEIFARPLQFGQVHITPDNTIAEKISSYIDSQYGNSCKPNCVIPLTLSGQPQTVQFKDVNLEYEESDGVPASSKTIVSLTTKDATISSDNLDIDISNGGFSVPYTPTSLLKVFLGNNTLFQTGINVSTGFSFDVSPRFSLIGVLIQFNAITPEEIVSSTWDFGDGAVSDMPGAHSSHKYTQGGEYNIKVELTRKDGKTSSKSVKIIVGNAKASAERLAAQYTTRLSNLSVILQRYPSWVEASIEKQIDRQNLMSSLEEIKSSMNGSLAEEDYADIVEQLLTLDVPYTILSTKTGTLPLTLGFSNMDVAYAEELSTKTFDDKDKLKEEIVRWMTNNYKTDTTFEEISSFGDNGKNPIITKFKISVSPLADNAEPGNLFIAYPKDEITFMRAYGESSVGDGAATSIPISGDQDIEFSIPGSISISDLGGYVSPDVASLPVEETPFTIDFNIQEKFKTKGFIIWISVLAVGTLTVYIILQEWYKRYYERYLFKSADDLYNIINFIYNSRSSGLKDEDIRKKLLGSGWSREQITYAFRKIAGKRTGMFEIPIFKFLENKKVRQEIQRRQGSPVDARFIKRPNL
ncbi:PKD domain-containing protein [Candidatus Pacearchaeota archaeon]|nr:PKD domain-containing protein [Candidatus Pacearchaeota archaeon]